MSRSITRCLVVAGSVLLAGCKEDLAPSTARFEAMTATWQQQLSELKTVGVEQDAVIADLMRTPGLDPEAPVSKGAVSLWFSAQNDRLSLEVVNAAIARNRELVAKSTKLAELNAASSFARIELASLLAAVRDNASIRQREIKDLGIAIGLEFQDRTKVAGADQPSSG